MAKRKRAPARLMTIVDDIERLDPLRDAMERRGNAEGTEAQLGDALYFLALAFELMSRTKQNEFMLHPDVSEFVQREG